MYLENLSGKSRLNKLIPRSIGPAVVIAKKNALYYLEELAGVSSSMRRVVCHVSRLKKAPLALEDATSQIEEVLDSNEET